MSDRMVTVARFRDLPEALVTLGKLESADIPAELYDDNMVRIDWMYSNAIGGIRLQVPEAHLDDAQAILAAPIQPTLEVETADGIESFAQPRCPRCGSLNIERLDRNRDLRYVAIFLFPVPIPPGDEIWHCADCTARWEEIEEGPGSDAASEAAAETTGADLYAATTNKGKLKEFRELAQLQNVTVEPVPHQSQIPEVIEDGATFEENAVKKAVEYSRHLPGALVFADDSGLQVTALDGAPGVHSARYAADADNPRPSDGDNNYRLLFNLRKAPTDDRSARFVCVIAVARDGELLGTFRGEAKGEILQSPLGKHGFGYDPLFYVPAADKTFAEMNAAEKAQYSHRGAAFREFLDWYEQIRGASH